MTTTLVDSPTPEAPTVQPPDLKRSWRGPLILAVIAVLSLVIFGLGVSAGDQTSFAIARPTDFFTIPKVIVPSQLAAVLLSVIALALAGLSAWYVQTRRKQGWWLPVLFGALVLLAMLVWAGAGKAVTDIPVTLLLAAGLARAIPLAFGAMAGLVCERSGVINIAIEGQLLAGAFLGAVVASATGSPYIGLIAAPLAGALVGGALALFAVRYWVNQIVVGVVLNVLVIGLTNFLFSTLLRDSPDLNQATPLAALPIPVLSQIPIIGPALFNANALVYLMYVVAIVLHIMLFKSRWGLRMRAVGEHPKAADTVGIKVNRTRILNTILGGAIAGLGGAFFTVASGLAFGKEMTSGLGYIALAAMILGRWTPKGAVAAAILFGFADALNRQLGVIGSPIPSQFLTMLPYLVTIFAVAGLVGHARPPAAEGIPYKK